MAYDIYGDHSYCPDCLDPMPQHFGQVYAVDLTFYLQDIFLKYLARH